MPRTTEEILEDLLQAARDGNARDVTMSLNRDGPVYYLFGGDLSSAPVAVPGFSHRLWGVLTTSAAGPVASYVTLVDTSGGPVPLELPSGLVDTATQPVVIKHVAGDATVSPVTVTDEDSATFDGEPSVILDQTNASVMLVASGGAWHVVSMWGG